MIKRVHSSLYSSRVRTCFCLIVGIVSLSPLLADAQEQASSVQNYEILGVAVEGADDESMRTWAMQVSGLRAGEQVSLPYDVKFGEAVRRLYNQGLFSDAQVLVDQVVGTGVFLTIQVKGEPRLSGYEIRGVSGGEQDDLAEELSLLPGRVVRPAEIEQGRMTIETFLRDKGYRLASVEVEQTLADDGRASLVFNVNKGERVKVVDVEFAGNQVFSDGKLRGVFDNTIEARWWRFWKRETFDESGYREDLDKLIKFYNDHGYFDARVVRDTFYHRRASEAGGRSGVVVRVEVAEGPQYRIRDVAFEGNTVFSDQELEAALGLQRGEVYDRSHIEERLFYSSDKQDIASLYMDRGHMRFNVEPQIVEVPGDSLDLLFEISEGGVYTIGDVQIAGNTRTKDHVIRRELHTVPGQRFSRQSIERSIRELMQLNYFEQSSLVNNPQTEIHDEDQEVDLTYNLTETSSDQLELSGGYGGGGLILQAGITFNNFSVQNLFNGSAWRPVPSGDGQQLSLRVQAQGTRWQSYSLSFTEPWFRGRPTPVGFSLGYQRYDSGSSADSYSYNIGSGQLFFSQRLQWPDDYFQTRTALGYRVYDLNNTEGTFGLPDGVSQELTVSQSLSRNNIDNPLFPSSGSKVGLSLTLAPPIPGFVQYHKWEFTNDWYTPILPRLSLGFKSRIGYIGSLTGDEVEFQRYLVGGGPLDSRRGRGQFGRDLVFFRGYPSEVIGPRRGDQLVGGRILNTYQLELQLVALQSEQLSFAPYLFLDAGNTWNSFDDYNPAELFRSVGVGGRIFLPILGMVDINAGYNLDTYDPITSGDDGSRGWRVQFSLGGQ